jgi:hypothetical protein
MPRSSATLVEDEEEADDENNDEEESHHISSTFTIHKIDEILHILCYYFHFSSTETRVTFQPVRSQYRTDRSRPFRVLA